MIFDQTFILVQTPWSLLPEPQLPRDQAQQVGLSSVSPAILPLFPMPSFFSPILFSFYYRDFLTSEEASYETGVIQTRLV